MTQSISNITAGLFNPYDYEDITVAATAIGLTAAKIRPGTGSANALNEAQRVTLTLEDSSIRYRIDGVDPTSAVGHFMDVGDVLTLMGQPAIDNFRTIRTGAVSGTFRVTFEK